MSAESKKPLNLMISVWVSPSPEIWYEPAWVLTYDDESIAIRSLTGYTVGQEILIGMETPRCLNGRHGIEALLKAKIFWGRVVDRDDSAYFEYQARFVPPASYIYP